MKILYISELDAYKQSGVLRKKKAQISEWNKECEVKSVLFSPPPTKNSPNPLIEADILTCKWMFNLLGSNSISIWLNRILCILQLRNIIKKFNPDIIYFRSIMWTPFFPFVLRKHKTIIDLNAIDDLEFNQLNVVWRIIYRIGKGAMYRNLSAVLAVSNEIAIDYQKTGPKKNIPIEVVSNGIYSIIDLSENNLKNQQIPHLVIVGTGGMSWHGFDKAIYLAEQLPNCKIIIIGEKLNIPLPSNVINYPFLEKKELEEIYQNVSIGLGTLALHRQGLEEASPLKVREYISYGVPVIGGYYDTDFSGKPYFLEIPNTETNVEDSLEEIKAFIKHWQGKHLDTKELQPYTFENKEKKRLLFFKKVVCSE